MKFQIHKNYFRTYWDIRDWNNVPEFVLFQTIPSNMISVILETGEGKPIAQEHEISDWAAGRQEGYITGYKKAMSDNGRDAKQVKISNKND